MPLASGEQLGPYKIVSLIGAGSMGKVYRATDTQLKRDVALKALLPAFAGDAERYVRFQREAELLASLNHPNIATLYGITEGALVMEFVEGESLPCPPRRSRCALSCRLNCERGLDRKKRCSTGRD